MVELREHLTSQLSQRLFLVHPPEPPPELLLAEPSDGIYIGKTRWLNVPVFWDYTKLINSHIAIVGITGAGKSYLVKTFLTRAAIIWESNAIILDWTGEYNKWVRQAGGKVVSLGKESLNLLDLAGLKVAERTKQIMSSFEILLDLHNFPEERYDIEEGLEKTYAKEKTPTLSTLVEVLEKNKKKHAARLLRRFLVEGSDFFARTSTLEMEKLAESGLVCIDLHSLPTEEMRSLAGLTILQFLKERMRKEELKEQKGIRLFVVVDEAWKIANDERSDVITIVREGRKYNFSIIVASQNPTDMHKTIISNVGTMFILRLVLREYKDYIRNSLNYSHYIDEAISAFGVGDAAVNMIFSSRSEKAHTFLLDKIDGEEPLFVYSIKVGNMNVEKEREEFSRMLYELGLTDEQINLVKVEFERGDGVLEASTFVSLLERFGYAHSSIMTFLRQLGIEEKFIVEVFSLTRRRRAAKGVVDLKLRDEEEGA
ncbi:ATP-binding protein [Candidatus Micrarchaeota archaeon]|nr:ATP-binding protein [Candidatus Micrarchaeota archaeon]